MIQFRDEYDPETGVLATFVESWPDQVSFSYDLLVAGGRIETTIKQTLTNREGAVSGTITYRLTDWGTRGYSYLAEIVARDGDVGPIFSARGHFSLDHLWDPSYAVDVTICATNGWARYRITGQAIRGYSVSATLVEKGDGDGSALRV